MITAVVYYALGLVVVVADLLFYKDYRKESIELARRNPMPSWMYWTLHVGAGGLYAVPLRIYFDIKDTIRAALKKSPR